MSEKTLEGSIHVLISPKTMEWFNTDTPISLLDLRGKIVSLDFWTLCCINCLHTTPDLKKLKEKFSDLETLEAKPHAGTGREARVDGKLLKSALTQPSSINKWRETLFR